jgi:hypothetical protein
MRNGLTGNWDQQFPLSEKRTSPDYAFGQDACGKMPLRRQNYQYWYPSEITRKTLHIHLSRRQLAISFCAGKRFAPIHLRRIEFGENEQLRIMKNSRAKFKAIKAT